MEIVSFSETLANIPMSVHGAKTRENVVIFTAVKMLNVTFHICASSVSYDQYYQPEKFWEG
jgi:hypothetical protein